MLHNTGTDPLQFYATAQKDQQPTDMQTITVSAGEVKTVTPELGASKEHPYLMVTNKTTNEGSFDLEIKKGTE